MFHHLFYEGNVDIHGIDDQVKKTATIGFINNFGQTPKQVLEITHNLAPNTWDSNWFEDDDDRIDDIDNPVHNHDDFDINDSDNVDNDSVDDESAEIIQDLLHLLPKVHEKEVILNAKGNIVFFFPYSYSGSRIPRRKCFVLSNLIYKQEWLLSSMLTGCSSITYQISYHQLSLSKVRTRVCA